MSMAAASRFQATRLRRAGREHCPVQEVPVRKRLNHDIVIGSGNRPTSAPHDPSTAEIDANLQ
eukprot:CAMPEP_0176089358 /NCGR_PEP_ID=MMETSP0120_2-20121206/44752_1 /TAXON_ID=160619 /ORGANISM="Kryptoperidinium foliaceum, Strain CCMP 1326" /LENGTH=62 /DNA_ID=CAMNT_0017423237 /DNA_START=278 /DNA_END=466 /DNA_ORIENTATION=-